MTTRRPSEPWCWRAATTELAATRDDVIEVVTTHSSGRGRPQPRCTTSRGVYEDDPRSVWGNVQGLARLSHRTRWQDGRFAPDLHEYLNAGEGAVLSHSARRISLGPASRMSPPTVARF